MVVQAAIRVHYNNYCTPPATFDDQYFYMLACVASCGTCCTSKIRHLQRSLSSAVYIDSGRVCLHPPVCGFPHTRANMIPLGGEADLLGGAEYRNQPFGRISAGLFVSLLPPSLPAPPAPPTTITTTTPSSERRQHPMHGSALVARQPTLLRTVGYYCN